MYTLYCVHPNPSRGHVYFILRPFQSITWSCILYTASIPIHHVAMYTLYCVHPHPSNGHVYFILRPSQSITWPCILYTASIPIHHVAMYTLYCVHPNPSRGHVYFILRPSQSITWPCILYAVCLRSLTVNYRPCNCRLIFIYSFLDLAPPIRVPNSISAPPQVSTPLRCISAPPSDQLDFNGISQPLGWRVKTTLKSTTLIKVFTLFYCGILSILFTKKYFVYKGQT